MFANASGLTGDGLLATLQVSVKTGLTVPSVPVGLADARLNNPYGRDFVLSTLQGTIQRIDGVLRFVQSLYLPLAIKN